MKSLQDMKQKGRALRKHLEAAFGKDVSLSQAYEALAAMEGATSWNALSAALAAPTTAPEQPAAPSVRAKQTLVSAKLPEIRAVFRTMDGKACATFDAAPWFAQAPQDDIDGLLREKVVGGPTEFQRAIGGKGWGDNVALFCSFGHEGLRNVYAYIKGLTDVGQWCGGSDCFVNALDVEEYLSATRASTYVADGLYRELKVIEVNLVEVLNEYDAPDEVPDWKWVEKHHSFAHQDNGAEPGVWEFMVRSDKMNDPEFLAGMPNMLRPFFERAKADGAPWIMFHQG